MSDRHVKEAWDYSEERAAILSTGVGIARLALKDDPPNVEKAIAALDEASRRTTYLMIEHLLKLGFKEDQIYSLTGGIFPQKTTRMMGVDAPDLGKPIGVPPGACLGTPGLV